MASFLIILTSPLHVLLEGTNPVRILLAGFFVVVLWAGCSALPRISLSLKRIIKITALTSLTALFLAGVVIQITLLAVHDVPQERIVTFIANDEITNTSLVHNHSGKVALTTFTNNVASLFVPIADTGGAIAAQFGLSVTIPVTLLLMIGVVSVIFASGIVLRDSEEKKKRALFTLLAITGFMSLVRGVDGGIFADGGLLAFIALIALLFFPVRYFIRALLIGEMLSLAVLTLLRNLSYIEGPRMFDSFLNTTILFLILLALACIHALPKRDPRVILVVCVAVLALVTKSYTDSIGPLRYLHSTPEEGYVGAYRNEAVLPREAIGSVGRLVLYAGMEEKPATVIDTYGLPYWYQPVARYAGLCTQPTSSIYMTFMTHTPQKIESREGIDNPLVSLKLEFRGVDQVGWNIYAGELTMHPCLPRRWDVLRESFWVLGAPEALFYEVRTWSSQTTP